MAKEIKEVVIKENKKEELIQENNKGFTNEQIQLLKNTIAKGQNLTDDEFQLFGMISQRTGLDPFVRQIYAVKRKNQDGQATVTFQTSIDGLRSIAERTGAYAGNDDYKFNEGITEYECIKNGIKQPTTATATVYKVVGNLRCPFIATAKWDEYYTGEKQGFMWRKMPFLMLGKCAEALAHRKAFPMQMSNIYTMDEMQQADNIKDVQNIESSSQNNHVQEKEKEDLQENPKPTEEDIALQKVFRKSILEEIGAILQDEVFDDKDKAIARTAIKNSESRDKLLEIRDGYIKEKENRYATLADEKLGDSNLFNEENKTEITEGNMSE